MATDLNMSSEQYSLVLSIFFVVSRILKPLVQPLKL